jgi:hypothetical protein
MPDGVTFESFQRNLTRQPKSQLARTEPEGTTLQDGVTAIVQQPDAPVLERRDLTEDKMKLSEGNG